MKHIIKISDSLGNELSTRLIIENFAKTLTKEDEYLFDMSGVSFISRSVADELFNISFCDYHVVLANMEPFVQKMMNVVSVSRFKTRDIKQDDIEIIHCETIKDLSDCLLSV
ncbi:MAG: hypothetical protein MJZ28_09720 [Paludibacteraceae bacterium]|nr:hypothetical protein [Paludibacteraceae bacterium]